DAFDPSGPVAAPKRQMRRCSGALALELAAALVQVSELLDQLGGEFVQRVPARVDQFELLLDELPRTVEHCDTFLVSPPAVPPIPERRPRLLGLGQRDELLERQAQQVPQPDELAEPRDVRLGVVAMRPFGTRFGAAEQSQLLVVANRPRRDA